MGLDKFFNNLDKDDIRIPDNSYKYKAAGLQMQSRCFMPARIVMPRQ